MSRRRECLLGATAVALLPLSARATPESMAMAIKEIVGEKTVREGRA